MSLLLSGCLGRAQLGAAELGAFQTVTTGAGFIPIFPDVGPLKQAAKKKKPKKPKKVKKPKKRKRVRITTESDTPRPSVEAGTSNPVLDTRGASTVPREIRQPEAPTTAVDTAAERLRETIAEEDELLVMLWN